MDIENICIQMMSMRWKCFKKVQYETKSHWIHFTMQLRVAIRLMIELFDILHVHSKYWISHSSKYVTFKVSKIEMKTNYFKEKCHEIGRFYELLKLSNCFLAWWFFLNQHTTILILYEVKNILNCSNFEMFIHGWSFWNRKIHNFYLILT